MFYEWGSKGWFCFDFLIFYFFLVNYDDFVFIYDQQYDSYCDDLYFYVGLVECVGGWVLEIGVGIGCVIVFLIWCGVVVFGVELSGEMIVGVQVWVVCEGLMLEFVQVMVQIFVLDECFGFIIVLFNVLMYFYMFVE